MAKVTSRTKLLLFGCLVPVVIALASVVGGGVWLAKNVKRPSGPAQPAWVPEDKKWSAWSSPAVVYDGPGRLDVYAPSGCAPGEATPDPAGGLTVVGRGVKCEAAFTSDLVPSPRELMVHTPPGYDAGKDRLPLIVAFHGFGQRPHHAALVLLPALEKAYAEGRLRPSITVFPDDSISGTGLDDLTTPYDDNGGSWGVDSNLGRFATHFHQELLPFVTARYRVSADPRDVVLLGGSMGGTIALNLMLDNPARFPNVGAFYPGLDLRYACNGDRLAAYTPDCYRPLADDDPKRPMVEAEGFKARFFNERMFLYPVFDSDRAAGPVWREDLPVWQRVRDANPVDRLRTEKPDLKGVSIWYVVGDRDDFNIDSQARVFEPLAAGRGAALAPADHVRPGKHDMQFFFDHVDEALDWVEERLKR